MLGNGDVNGVDYTLAQVSLMCRQKLVNMRKEWLEDVPKTELLAYQDICRCLGESLKECDGTNASACLGKMRAWFQDYEEDQYLMTQHLVWQERALHALRALDPEPVAGSQGSQGPHIASPCGISPGISAVAPGVVLTPLAGSVSAYAGLHGKEAGHAGATGVQLERKGNIAIHVTCLGCSVCIKIHMCRAIFLGNTCGIWKR